MSYYFVRIGTLSEIHIASALLPLRRGDRVVVRTRRGVEIGVVSAPCTQIPRDQDAKPFCRIMRPTTAADEMLVERLERDRRQALEACREKLDDSGSQSTLLDIDQLFSGDTIVIHFLGEVDSIAKSIIDEISEQYESIVKTHHLAELLREGCGPECGTKGGCGAACATCNHCG